MALTHAPGDSLRALVAAPTIWALHFLVCYVVAAVHCAKAGGPGADLEPVRLVIAVATALALIGIAGTGWLAYRHVGHFAGLIEPHEADTEADRRRFLSIATLMLSALSFVATLFVAAPALFVTTCR